MCTPLSEDRVADDATAVGAACKSLAAWERRAIVTYFLERENQTATVSDLIDRCRERGPDGRDAVPADRLRARLHHHHLPRLADEGVVDYDPRNLTVQYRGDDRVESLLSHVQ